MASGPVLTVGHPVGTGDKKLVTKCMPQKISTCVKCEEADKGGDRIQRPETLCVKEDPQVLCPEDPAGPGNPTGAEEGPAREDVEKGTDHRPREPPPSLPAPPPPSDL